MQRKIVTWYGEGRSLFYVVEYDPTEPLEYTILGSFDMRENAEKMLA